MTAPAGCLRSGWATPCSAMACPNRVLTFQQLAPEQAVEFLAPALSAVCFVDMAVDEHYEGKGARLRLARLNNEAAAATTGHFTHEVGPLVLLAYAAVLGARVPPAWLLTVDGFAFDHGEGLSAAVQAALADDAALAEIRAHSVRRGLNPAPLAASTSSALWPKPGLA